MSNYANQAEILAAFAALTTSDLLALKKSASLRLSGSQYSEPADLIHEALIRTLDGRRQWPRHVPFSVFISNAMRSIANTDRSRYGSQFVRSIGHSDEFNERHVIGHAESYGQSPERYLIDQEEERERATLAREALDSFENDDAVTAVIASRMEGLTAKQALAVHQISAHEYDAARKRLERNIASKSNSGRLH